MAALLQTAPMTCNSNYSTRRAPAPEHRSALRSPTAHSPSPAEFSPRQPVTATPYSIRSASAAVADTASTATNATQLGGVAAGQYVLTSDSRLSDPRPPTAGSSNYIQNTTSQQGSSNFNISGNGTAGGTLSANIVNASTQYNIGGNRVFAIG